MFPARRRVPRSCLGASAARSRVTSLPPPAAVGGARRRPASASAPSSVMVATRPLALLAALLALQLVLAHRAHAAPQGAARVRRQLADDNTLQPLDDENGDEQAREKRKLEGITQAKFGIKNAVLGFVFGKINSIIDSKTRLVETLDRQNIELNKQYGIEAPKGGLSSLSGIVGQVIGPKLQFLGPKIQAVSGLFGASSGSSGGSAWRYVEAPGGERGAYEYAPHVPRAHAAQLGLVQSAQQPLAGFTGQPVVAHTEHPEFVGHRGFVGYTGQPDSVGYSGRLDTVGVTRQPVSDGYTGQPISVGYAGQSETYGYISEHQHTRAASVKRRGAPRGTTSQEAGQRHPGLRSQQGQPGLPGEPVWTLGVASDPHH